MGGAHRVVTAVMLLAAASAACSSAGDSDTAGDEMAAPSPPTQPTASDRTVRPHASDTASDAALPSVHPEAVDPTRTALSATPIGVWADAAAATPVTPSDPCTNAIPQMDAAETEGAVVLPDAVLGELLLNLDAAAGALSVACANGDAATAEQEAESVNALQQQVAARLEEFGR